MSGKLLAALAAAALAATGCVKRDAMPPLTGPLLGANKPMALSLPVYGKDKVYDLATDRGRVVLLDVWATWCEPCRDALPLYEQFQKEYGERGLRVYALNVDGDQREIPRFVQETRLSLPILLDKNGVLSEGQLKVTMMPTTFLLDRQGAIRFVHEGFAEEFLAKYQAEIEQLLSEPSK